MNLLDIEGLPTETIEAILDRAEHWWTFGRRSPKVRADALAGRTVVNLFFEASTRTRTSFEIAAKRLGADVINVSSSFSSATKGETLLDTARNIEAMRVDVIVLRHASSGAPHHLARNLSCAIVNAGDGTHEHPTQALLDAFTMRKHKGRIEGLVVAICGDITHSRVARSNAHLLSRLGAEVRFAGPRTMLPPRVEELGPRIRAFSRFEDALSGADVVMMLRIQNERLAGAMMSTTREYRRTFGLDRARLALAKPDALVMHPGPINRGVELTADVADGSASAILDQVEAGVAVRAAVLEKVVAA